MQIQNVWREWEGLSFSRTSSAVNLNDYVTNTYLHVLNAAAANNGQNFPIAGSGGFLLVRSGYPQSNIVHQQYFARRGSAFRYATFTIDPDTQVRSYQWSQWEGYVNDSGVLLISQT